MRNIEEIVNSFVIRTKHVYKLYGKLSFLEMAGKKDSPEYDEYFGYLKMMRDIEAEFLATLSMDECEACIVYMKRRPLVEDITKRIRNHIFNKISNSSEGRCCVIESWLSTMFEDRMKGKSLEDQLKFYREVQLAYKECERDITYLAFFISEEYLSFIGSKVKRNLIWSKYSVAYFEPKFEETLISTKFAISENIETPNYKSSLISDVDIQDIRETFAQLLGEEALNQIVNIGDINFNDSDILKQSIWAQCLLRSCLLMLSDDRIVALEAKLAQFEETDDNQICIQIARECFRKRLADKEKVFQP